MTNVLATETEASPFIGVREAAKRLNVHENTIRNWVQEGVLTNAKIKGAHAIRLVRVEVDALVAGRHTERVESATREAVEAVARLRAALEDAQAFLDVLTHP